MSSKNTESRVDSLIEVSRLMTDVKVLSYEFIQNELDTYRGFANSLSNIISKIYTETKYKTNIDEIIRKLEICYQNSILEEDIQNVSNILLSFINRGGYTYLKNEFIPTYILRGFITLMKSASTIKKKIILSNLWEQFDQKGKIINSAHNDLPF